MILYFKKHLDILAFEPLWVFLLVKMNLSICVLQLCMNVEANLRSFPLGKPLKSSMSEELLPVLNIEQTNPNVAAVRITQLTCNPKHCKLQAINRL